MITNTKPKHYIFFLLMAFLLLVGIFLPNLSINATSNEDIERIYDYTDTLSQQEISSLEDLADTYYNKTGYNFLVVITNTREEYSYTHNSSLEINCERYSEAFYDDFVLNYGESNADCAILTLDISENRYADVSGQGILSEKLTNQRCQLVYNHIVNTLSSNDWYNAAKKYMKLTAKYIEYKENINPDSFIFQLWFQTLISILISAVIVGMLIFHSNVKMTVNERTYLNTNNSNIISRYDHYIRTSTRRTKRSSNSSSSRGHRSGGRRSGGGSHGGGHF